MEDTLKNFMQEFFPFNEFLKIGFFTNEMKADYKAQAERVCQFYGYKSVYEYGSKEIRCHITYTERPLLVDENGKLKLEPFIAEIESIYN